MPLLVVIKLFLAKYWAEILMVLAVVLVVGVIYGKGRVDGAESCNKKWQAKEDSRVEKFNEAIDSLKKDSIDLAKNQKETSDKLGKGVDKVIKELAKLPPSQVTNVYTTKEDCKPSKAYIDKWNEINEEATRSIK